MQISRNFLVAGSLYLLVGIVMGMYMGGSGDHTLMPVHAHINLLGFTLMTLFGLVYRVVPELTASSLARVHFWMHQLGVLVLLVLLFLIIGGFAAEARIGPFMPIGEVVILGATLCFALNLWRNAR
jgi:hypothetical protein